MTTNYLQGPIRSVDVLDALAWEDSTARDRAMNAGRHSTDAYHLAWQWLTAVVLEGPRPELPFHAEQALKRVQLSTMHRLESDR